MPPTVLAGVRFLIAGGGMLLALGVTGRLARTTGRELRDIAIMAALNIAHELLSTKVSGGFDIAELKRRMNRMETVLDQALRDQGKPS